MISLGYFLIAWIILLALYALLVLLTLLQMLRHGLPSFMTYFTTFVFLLVIIGVVAGTGIYLVSVDWSMQVNVIPEGLLFIFGIGGQTPEIPISL